ncbi:hypothetical protein QBC40DRAFT_287040 [Triangularia verruculosa]|uniref:Uncharacterized protein n=1 Tax=Triangularia verruculosa TaxID=2587418 RepID=A0AAN6X9G9_9PEZI|nr:hypothetical protein QBC40DRAFT_287040 [Triangularia verruculosa]
MESLSAFIFSDQDGCRKHHRAASLKARHEDDRLKVCEYNDQIQCLTQILCNRASLLIYNHDDARRLKLGVGLVVGLINISVFCIWVPARLQISQTFITLNKHWGRTEKILFLIIACCLDVYFIYMVRTKLIANTLTKYELAYRFNLLMVFVSFLLDVLIIVLMFWDDDALNSKKGYMQAHPLVYLSKLYIEDEPSRATG